MVFSRSRFGSDGRHLRLSAAMGTQSISMRLVPFEYYGITTDWISEPWALATGPRL